MRGEQPLRSVPEIFGVDALASVHVHVEPIRVFVVELREGKTWDALGVKSPPPPLVTAYDPAVLAIMAVDLVDKPLDV